MPAHQIKGVAQLAARGIGGVMRKGVLVIVDHQSARGAAADERISVVLLRRRIAVGENMRQHVGDGMRPAESADDPALFSRVFLLAGSVPDAFLHRLRRGPERSVPPVRIGLVDPFQIDLNRAQVGFIPAGLQLRPGKRGFAIRIPADVDAAAMDIVGDTIADYWGIEKAAPEFDDNKGVSLVLVNNEAGEKAFEKAKKTLIWKQTKLEDSLQPPLSAPFPKPENREQFWSDFENKSFEYIAKKYGGIGLKNDAKLLLRKIKRKVKKLVSKGGKRNTSTI